MNRRTFLRRLGWGVGGVLVGGVGIQGAYEKRWFEVTRHQIAIDGLPNAFEGMTISHIADVHHGPYTPIERVSAMVDLAQSTKPDMFVITGDMVHRESKYIGPVWKQMARLSAPLGVWCVMGNHDHWEGIEPSRAAAKMSGISELRNEATALIRGGERLWLAGVGDKWSKDDDVEAAVSDLPENAPAIMIVHNPETSDRVTDPRVKFMMAGHSHGGQVVLPILGAVSVPCDRRFTAGLVKTAAAHVYVSRGLGVVTVPFRLNCRPEIPVYTLTRG